MTSAVLNSAPSHRTASRGLSGWKFWLPTLLVLLAIAIPDFAVVNVLQAAGVDLESNLVATMATENSLREAAYLLSLLALGAAGVLLLMPGNQRQAPSGSVYVGLILGTFALAVSSLLWSDDIQITFRRLVVAGLCVLGCWGIGRAWQTIDLVRMVLWLSATFAITGIAAEIYYGSFLAAAGYRFSGFLHPNQQALSCGLLVLAAMAMKTRTGRLTYWIVALVAYSLLLMTGSRGGVVACTAAVGFYLVFATPAPQRIVWFMLASLACGGGLLYLALEPAGGSRLEALAKLGRDDPQADPKSLTGRLPIWNQIVSDIRQRPAVGYGYAAYWTAERVHRMSYIHDWEFSNAHSSYLEVMLAFGLVGFGWGLLTVVAVFVRGLVLYATAPDWGLLFVLAVFVMAFTNGLIESNFVSVGYGFTVWLIGAFMIAYYPSRAMADAPAAWEPA